VNETNVVLDDVQRSLIRESHVVQLSSLYSSAEHCSAADRLIYAKR